MAFAFYRGLGGGGAMYWPRISPHDPNLMFVACDMRGLYRSADGGRTWTLLDTRTVFGGNRFSVAIDPDPANRDRIVGFRPHQGLKESTDGGITWHNVQPALVTYPGTTEKISVTALMFSPESPSRLLVGTARGVLELVSGSWGFTHQGTEQVYATSGTDQFKVYDSEVVDFAAAKASSGAVRQFVATLTDVLERTVSGSAVQWTSIGGSLPSRPLGPFFPADINNVTYQSRVRALAGTQGTTGPVLYAIVSTDAAATNQVDKGGVYRYTGGAWTQEASGLDLNATMPPYHYLGIADNEADTPYVTTRAPSGPVVYRRTVTGGTANWLNVYEGRQNVGTTNLEPGWCDQQPANGGLGWGFGGAPSGFTVDPKSRLRAMLTNWAVVQSHGERRRDGARLGQP